LLRNPVKALFTGAAAGLVQDSFSGGPAVGVSGLAYVFAAYITHRIAAFIVVDNLPVRFLAVAAASIVNTLVRLFFYRLLKIELPVLAGGQTITAEVVFGLFANLIASILLYILLDRLFMKNASLRMRRNEARRRRL
jgi:rod shape-determining protein MreD